MNNKLKITMKRSKKAFIFGLILWIIITIVLIVPFATGITLASLVNDNTGLKVFVSAFAIAFKEPFSGIPQILKYNGLWILIFCEFVFTLIYLVAFFIGFNKLKPKHEFDGIEHGSSDWSEDGEQYAVLNKHKGIILAEDNYLPVDKRGNVNVLVVGRIWIW